MADKCHTLPRFTHAGEKYDRWYCQGCCAVMFLPHGEPAPDEHEKGQNILPPEGAEMPPLPPVRALVGFGLVSDPNAPKAPAQAPITALQRYTSNLPGDIPIVKKEK